MTQHLLNPDKISNWFDHVLFGIGRGGSSFTDLDFAIPACTHDKVTDRFLFQEMKASVMPIPKGQDIALRALAKDPKHTVWIVYKRDATSLWWRQLPDDDPQVITCEEYRERFRQWWYTDEYLGQRRETAISSEDVIAAEIARWRIAADTAAYNLAHWTRLKTLTQSR
jgi:hypothetical protein